MLKQRFVGWLSEYNNPLWRKNPDRDARFIYNKLNAPMTILWLAAAAGIDERIIGTALKRVKWSERPETSAAAARKVLAWDIIAHKLDEWRPSASHIARNFVAYHNREQIGQPFLSGDDASGIDEATFFTAKQFRPETLLGNRLWVFEGSGSPRRYTLACHGTIVGLKKRARPAWYQRKRRRDGRSVVFRLDDPNPVAVDVTGLGWFKRLRIQQQSFQNGLNSIDDSNAIFALHRLANPSAEERSVQIAQAQLSREAKQTTDLIEIASRKRDETTRKIFIDARLGQGQFRADVARLWSNACAVTGCDIPEMLRASHMKPWNISNDGERLDPQNGLLLAAHVDALFDRGLISFWPNGTMMISDAIDSANLRRLRLPSKLRQKLSAGQQRFLAHHRRSYFN
ncbi:HNH endonuclease [Bradyrhizobium sp. AUGA SZCCT0158]|uniref:HNH endonuclease n=1 Tax=Bradyrhizobium sp. AUGA SZCCT0158 TaxID=2807661 RepID=UPI001BA5AE9C|nr:HNH endonuclease [Bradyrhizobium sp. AUGA SZCCT0158]MBR1197785.1 HNH endonuclease [Bradyrhizobium sp. AUGA SZCCT0158]